MKKLNKPKKLPYKVGLTPPEKRVFDFICKTTIRTTYNIYGPTVIFFSESKTKKINFEYNKEQKGIWVRKTFVSKLKKDFDLVHIDAAFSIINRMCAMEYDDMATSMSVHLDTTGGWTELQNYQPIYI